MSKSEFLQNLNTARNIFFHRVKTDRDVLDPETVEAQLTRSAIWLTPASVKGFRENDFPELSPEVRSQLKKDIAEFAKAAKEASPDQPVGAEQVRKAMQCFLRILSVLDSYISTSGEAQRIREALEATTYPAAVLNWNFELRTDSTGDPAVWIWIFVDSETAARSDFMQLADEIEQLVRESLAAADVSRWPYVRFRTASEQRALSS